jgi:hypothetical protein
MYERGDVPLWMGLWWVHVAGLLLGIAMIRVPPVVAALWWRLRRSS